MFIIHIRKTFVPAEHAGAVVEYKFRRAEAKEPALNASVRMLTFEAMVFKTMQNENLKEHVERAPTAVTTFTITEE